MINFETKKVLFIDLDGTLIKTISGKIFPEDITDFRIQLPVLNKVIEKFPNLGYFFIVTNQGGIGKFITEDDFKTKISSICIFCGYYLGDRYNQRIIKDNWDYCDSMDNDRSDQQKLIDTLVKAQVEGWKVKIKYHQVWGVKNVFKNRGESDYFVDDVIVLDKNFSKIGDIVKGTNKTAPHDTLYVKIVK